MTSTCRDGRDAGSSSSRYHATGWRCREKLTTLRLGQRGDLLTFYLFIGDVWATKEMKQRFFRLASGGTRREEMEKKRGEPRGDGRPCVGGQAGEQLKRRGKHWAKLCGDKNR